MPAPGTEAIEDFCAFADPIYEQIKANELESKQLEELRDVLLPRLMSGKIDVSKVNLTQLNSHLSDHSVAIREINNSTIADATFINRFIALRMLFEKLSHGIRHAFDIRGQVNCQMEFLTLFALLIIPHPEVAIRNDKTIRGRKNVKPYIVIPGLFARISCKRAIMQH